MAQRMASVDGNTVIHRMARASREEYQARAMLPAKALRLALAQASDRLFDLPMVVSAVEQIEASQTALASEFSEGGLLVLLDGPNGARGAVRLDDALLSALVEVQTTGRISGRGSGGRTLTRTDAAIAAPLIDEALSGAEAKLAAENPGEAAPHWIAGYRFGVMMEDARGMTLALNAAAFHVFRIMVEVGDAAHPGAITFLLPAPETAPAPLSDTNADTIPRTLEQSAMDAPVSLEAVLGRVSLPLDQLCGLLPGGKLPFTMDRPMQIRLETCQKHVVALARLGQLNGARAVRLTPDSAAPDDSSHLDAIAAVSVTERGAAPVLDMPPATEVFDGLKPTEEGSQTLAQQDADNDHHQAEHG